MQARAAAAVAALATLLLAAHAADPLPRTMDAYMRQRAGYLEQEQTLRFDRFQTLSEQEQVVNRSLLALKEADFHRMELNWPPELPFLKAKPLITPSPLFAFLQRVPKGGMLHAHEMSMVDVDFFIQNGTYLDECYLLLNDSSPQNGTLQMLATPPPAGSELRQVNALRAAFSGTAAQFDDALRQDLLLGEGYANGIVAWETFQSLFGRIWSVYMYRPVYELWFHRLCQNMLDDNVAYLELRQAFGGLYDFEHGAYTKQEQLDAQNAISNEYARLYPDRFVGVTTIWSTTRTKSDAVIYSTMEEVLAFRRSGNNAATMLGFDLVGEEHTGNTALYYVPAVLKLRQAYNLSGNGDEADLPFFFHAGESDWWYNRNVLDAVMMGTRRIGHGFSLGKHPQVRDLVIERGVAVEVCPISNRELLLLEDLRNHPAAEFVRTGVPFVLASDDPALYGYEEVSYDWYMGTVSWDMDLASLKQLAYNSIVHSGLLPADKARALATWQSQWDAFIDAEARALA